MATVQIAGLASGFNWTNLVNQLIQADSAPIAALQAQQATLAQQNTDLGTLQDKMTALQTSLATLNDPTIFSQRSATLSSPLWSATATSSALPASHIIAVSQLASASRLQGASQIGQAIRPDGDASQVLISAMNLAQPITAGEFTVNGVRVNIATTDTLQQVFQKISDATNGTVTGSYDGTTDKVTLTGADPTTGAPVPVTVNSANDTSNFLTALKLTNNGTSTVQSSSRLGAANLDAPLAQAGLATALTGLAADGSGSMVINGATISYNANTDTISSVLNSINNSAAGVTATYDPSQDRIVFTNNVTGDLGASVVDATGNLGAALGLTTGASLVHGTNAEFTVDGGATLTSTSNTVGASLTGITGVTMTLGSATTQQVNIAADNSSASADIQDFVTKYNDLQSTIDSLTQTSVSGTTVTTSDLTNDPGVAGLARTLRAQAFQAFSGGSGAVSRLESLGIDFNGTSSQLVVKDPTKLASMLQSNSADVSAFFTNPTSGFVAGFNTVINDEIGVNGSLPNEQAANSQKITSITSQTAQMQTHLDAERASLTAEFVAMEQAQSLLQSQEAEINSALGTTSSSSSSTPTAASNETTALSNATVS